MVSVDSSTTYQVDSTSALLQITGSGLLTVLPASSLPVVTQFPRTASELALVPVVVEDLAQHAAATNISNATFNVTVASFDPANAGKVYLNMSASLFGWRSVQAGLVQIGTISLVNPVVTPTTTYSVVVPGTTAAPIVATASTTSAPGGGGAGDRNITKSDVVISSNADQILINGSGFSVITRLHTVQLVVNCTASSGAGPFTVPNEVLSSTATQLKVQLLERFPSDQACTVL